MSDYPRKIYLCENDGFMSFDQHIAEDHQDANPSHIVVCYNSSARDVRREVKPRAW